MHTHVYLFCVWVNVCVCVASCFLLPHVMTMFDACVRLCTEILCFLLQRKFFMLCVEEREKNVIRNNKVGGCVHVSGEPKKIPQSKTAHSLESWLCADFSPPNNRILRGSLKVRMLKIKKL